MNGEKDIDRTLVKACRLFYQFGRTKTEIANSLKISITHVNRLLEEARERGILQISINAPRFTELELELIDSFGLVDARVVAYDEDESLLRAELGREAANYFSSKVMDGSKIGIGSGRTMFEMVKMLKEQPKALSFFPLTVIAQRDTAVSSIDANTLVNTLWFKFRPVAKGYSLNLFYPHMSIDEVENEIRHLMEVDKVRIMIDEMSGLDFYLFSVGNLRRDSVIMSFAQEQGQSFDSLSQLGIIGDFLFNTININGEHILCGLEGVSIGVTLGQLKGVVEAGKEVIVVAGGFNKIAVIKAGLKAKLFNILITDNKTAVSLMV